MRLETRPLLPSVSGFCTGPPLSPPPAPRATFAPHSGPAHSRSGPSWLTFNGALSATRAFSSSKQYPGKPRVPPPAPEPRVFTILVCG